MSSNLRITGLSTGLDVDSIVKQLMTAENTKVNKVKQERQIIAWRQEMYRSIMGDLNTFKSTYFDVLKSDTYMLSNRNFSTFNTKTSDNGATFSATAFGSAVPGTYTVTVSKLAEKARVTGIYSEINVERAVSDVKFPAQISAANNNTIISITAGTASGSITIEDGNYYMPDLVNKINQKIATSTDLNNKVKASLTADGKSIRFVGVMEITDANKSLTVNIDGVDHAVTLTKGNLSLDDIASQINSKLAADKVNGKVKAGVSTDGTSLIFTDTEGDGSSSSVGGIAVGDGGTLTDATYSISTLGIINNDYNDTTKTLEYDRKIIAGVNDTLSIVVNGVSYTAKLNATDFGKPSSGTTDIDIRNNIVSNLRNALTTATDKNGQSVDLTTLEKLDVRLSLDNTRIEFVSNTNKTVSISGNANTTLGFSSSFDISMNINDQMSSVLGGSTTGTVSFTINDGSKSVDFYYDFNSDTNVTADGITIIGAKNKTISDIANEISSKTNAKLSYSELTRKFTLESSSTGQTQSVAISSKNIGDTVTDNFLNILFGDISNGGMRSDTGEDAKVTIASPNSSSSYITVVKPTNNFTIDGINFTLVKENPDNPQTLTVTSNTQNAFDNIKALIDKYNEIIDKINSKITERKQYTYLPLTDDQKKEMSDTDIENWEKKAKQGILSSDSTLDSMLTAMRMAFYDPVKVNYSDPTGSSIGIRLSDIGLSTSSDYTQRGKIIIDEAKLKSALETNGDKVMNLFTKTSTSVSYYSPSLTNAQRNQRYAESGIFQRLNDILQDNLRTSRDSNGRKGVLLEKAGIVGDYSEYHNLLTNDLKEKDTLIEKLINKLNEKENRYYEQFSKLETAMTQLNSQSSWITQMMGGSSGS